MMHHIHPQHILKDLVFPFSLFICLWMISCVEHQFCPKSTNSSFQNLEVNLLSLLEMIFLGTPCNLVISQMKIFDISLAELVNLTATKCTTLLNLSITPMIVSCCLNVLGNPVTKSMDITSHFHSKMGIGCNNLVGFAFNLYLLAFHAFCNKFYYFFLQIRPIVKLFDGCEGLLISWMARIWFGMELLKYELLQFIVWHIDPIFEFYKALFCEVIFLTLLSLSYSL